MWQNQLGKTLESEQLSKETDETQAKKYLMEYIDYLIIHDISRLIYLLYKIDIPEKKIKSLLENNPQERSSSLIADEMIHRQLEKMRNYAFYTKKFNHNTSEEDKW